MGRLLTSMPCCNSITEIVCPDPAIASAWPGEAADVTQAASTRAAEIEIRPRLCKFRLHVRSPVGCSNANLKQVPCIHRGPAPRRADNRPRLIVYDSATVKIYSRRPNFFCICRLRRAGRNGRRYFSPPFAEPGTSWSEAPRHNLENCLE